MKILIFYLTVLSIILPACYSSEKYSETKYDDQPLSKTEKINGIYSRKFIRHGLTYFDKIKGKRLVERKVYDDNKLIYKYPITQSTLPKIKIWLASKNNFLQKSIIDTVFFFHKELPVMNRHVWAKGALISMISDSSYLIKLINETSITPRFYISVSDNYEEIKKGNGFICDSLILSIK